MPTTKDTDAPPEALSPAEEQRLAAMIVTMREAPYWAPGNSKRLDKAVQLYREGGVVQVDTHLFDVKASDDPEPYRIERTCPCAFSQHREDRFCSHRIAVALYQKLHAIPPDAPDDEDIPAPGPAAADRGEVCGPDGDMPAPDPLPPGPVVTPRLPQTLTCRSITAIIADLSRPFPAAVATKKVSGEVIAYLHWQTVARLLDTYAPGWTGEVTRLEQHGQTLRVTYRIGIPCAEGIDWREAIGEDDEWGEDEKSRFGTPAANAQANAFKRAAALFGCGQWLYDKKEDLTAKGLVEYFRQEKQAAIAELGKALLEKGMDRKQALDWLKTTAGVTSIDHIPIVAIKTLLSHVITTPEVRGDLQGYPESWLTEAEKRQRHALQASAEGEAPHA